MSKSFYHYGKNEKKIMFADTDKRHADLKLKLRRDGLTQLGFFQSIVTGYLANDENIVAYVTTIKEELTKVSKKKISRCREDIALGKSTLEDYGFSDKERKFLFDTIEKGEE